MLDVMTKPQKRLIAIIIHKQSVQTENVKYRCRFISTHISIIIYFLYYNEYILTTN